MARRRVTAATRHARAKRAGLLELGGYDVQLARQGGACCVCGWAPAPGKPRLHVDHSHRTMAVRGLLCWRCNRTLGASRDDADALMGLGIYLRYGWAGACAYRDARRTAPNDPS